MENGRNFQSFFEFKKFDSGKDRSKFVNAPYHKAAFHSVIVLVIKCRLSKNETLQKQRPKFRQSFNLFTHALFTQPI
jgi:hypothetical protein